MLPFLLDSPEPWQLGLQDAASPISEEVVFFHDQVVFLLTVILSGVSWVLLRALLSRHFHRFLVDGALVEIVWTILPAVVLVFLAFPSLKLLYLMDEVVEPCLTVKAVGHQWFWSYELSDASLEPFDSFMVPTAELDSGDLRLLEVDQRLVVPVHSTVRLLVTAADVLHSFAVPSLAVKLDAVPGRLNQANFFVKRPGVFYGQCSEICGANHSFMPIVVEAVSLERFAQWVFHRSLQRVARWQEP